MINTKYFILNDVFVDDSVFIENTCPYKDGDKLLFGDVYYSIVITNDKNKSKIFHKLKKFIPELWHQYIDFIVNK